jgi:hypothetical protein
LRYAAYATAEAIARATDAADAHALLAAAAVVSMRRRHVVSHESAAIIHHLDLLNEPGVVSLTAEPEVRSRARHGLAIRAAAVPESHAMSIHGVLVTTPARTVADLARTLPFMDAVVVADSAIRKLKASKRDVRGILLECHRWPGKGAAERVIDFSNGRAESVLESCARAVFHGAGLPAPDLQAEFFDRETLATARVDFYWPEFKTVAEADGMAKYENPGDMRRQFKRDRLLRDLGCKVVHFTWHELFDYPERVIARIRQAFAAPSPW